MNSDTLELPSPAIDYCISLLFFFCFLFFFFISSRFFLFFFLRICVDKYVGLASKNDVGPF